MLRFAVAKCVPARTEFHCHQQLDESLWPNWIALRLDFRRETTGGAHVAAERSVRRDGAASCRAAQRACFRASAENSRAREAIAGDESRFAEGIFQEPQGLAGDLARSWSDRVSPAYQRPRGRFLPIAAHKYETSVVPGRFFEMPEHFRIGIGGTTENVREGLA